MIAVDVGNTSLNFFSFKRGKIAGKISLPTEGVTKKAIKARLAKFPREPILLCSVVPKVNKLFFGLGQKVYLIGRDIEVPIDCQYNKAEVGSDRLVAAFAAKILFPKVRIVLDFGTAITLDFLSLGGGYQGGIILPGAGSTLSVFSNCALLPKKIRIVKTMKTIPANTAESISRGLVDGFSTMINGLVKKYRKALKIPPSGVIVITGGEATWVKSSLNFNYCYEPDLVAYGLQILAQRHLT